MIVLVAGSSGMLGQCFVSTLMRAGAAVICPSLQDMDITSELSVRRFFKGVRPSLVINCAAYTDVDGCEKNPEKAFAVNGRAVDYLGAAARRSKAKFIHVSTDYVMDGTLGRPYIEADSTNPVQVYGASKLEGEKLALQNNGVVFRVQWLFGQGKANFVDWVATSVVSNKKVSVSADQTGSPSSCTFVANTISAATGCAKRGSIYHVSHENYGTRLDLAKFICEYLRADPSLYLEVAQGAEFGVAKRPITTSLNPGKLKRALGISSLGTWQADVMAYLMSRYNTWG